MTIREFFNFKVSVYDVVCMKLCDVVYEGYFIKADHQGLTLKKGNDYEWFSFDDLYAWHEQGVLSIEVNGITYYS